MGTTGTANVVCRLRTAEGGYSGFLGLTCPKSEGNRRYDCSYQDERSRQQQSLVETVTEGRAGGVDDLVDDVLDARVRVMPGRVRSSRHTACRDSGDDDVLEVGRMPMAFSRVAS